MSVIQNNLLMTPEGYQISRSVRLRSSASAYFSRTPASAGNRKTWTWSGWVKRGTLGTSNRIFSADDGSASTDQDYNTLFFNSSDQLQFSGNLTNFRISTAVYRDPSAWYHIVFAVDTTQATAANRFKLYVNGSEVTSFGTSNNPSQNTDLAVNAAIGHFVGSIASGSYFDGYLTEVNFIDGQALTPSSFGETDAVTGVWKPKKYAGTYGTNGFYLNFSDNSNNTAATIGKDYSGNGNNWTPNNISVTAGSTYDSMLDVPTMWADGGNGRGNYCVINPLDVQNASSVAQGNQYISFSAVNYGHSRCTMAAFDSSYWEVVAGGTNYLTLGVANSTAFSSFNWAGCWAIYQSDGKVYNNAAAITGVLATFTTNDVIGFAVKGNKLYIAKNGTWLNSGDPVAGTGFVASSMSSEVFPYIGNGGGAAGTPSAYFNAGQRPFAYTPPTGFKALNTQNLPDATIKKGNQYFDATTYTGNGSTQSIVNAAGFQPDLVWMKGRSVAYNNTLFDSVRGVTKRLISNATNIEETASGVTAFNSNGFSVGNNIASNENAATYVGWQWKKGATQGFDIVTYTGTGSARTIAHSLGVKPSMIIIKNRSAVGDWATWHQYLPNPTTQQVWLNATNAAQVAGAFNATQPTSSVFSVGTTSETNGNGNNLVAYLFAEVAGFSKFGSYTGNGSVDGPFVHLGFKPRLVMIKRTDTTSNWIIKDTSRSAYNAGLESLYPNLSNAEGAGETYDIVSNGFKLRSTSTEFNASGGTYIYAAFAESPFKTSLAR